MNIVQSRIARIRQAYHWWELDRLNDFSWHFQGGREHFKKEFKEIVSSHKWVFIVGCNNSGTSILQRMLGRVGSVSTFKKEGQRYTQVLPRAYRRGYERVYMEYADALKMKGSVEQNGPRLVHDWTRHLPQPLSDIILEKTPANATRMQWLQECFPNSRFIGLVRNGYAVSEGINRKSHKSFSRAAGQWQHANKVLLENSKNVDHYRQFHYEDIVEDPGAAVSALAAFVGAEGADISDVATASYDLPNVRGDTPMGLRNLNQDSFGRLTQQHIDIIYQHAGELLDHYNYDLNR